MAENQIKIKLVLDTSDTSKVTKELDILKKSVESTAKVDLESAKKTSFFRENQRQALEKLSSLETAYNSILEARNKQLQSVSNSIANIRLKETLNAGIIKEFSASIDPLQTKIKHFVDILNSIPAKLGNISRSNIFNPASLASTPRDSKNFFDLNPGYNSNGAQLAQLKEYYKELERSTLEGEAKRLQAEATYVERSRSLRAKTIEELKPTLVQLKAYYTELEKLSKPSPFTSHSGYGFAGSQSSGGTYDTTKLGAILGSSPRVDLTSLKEQERLLRKLPEAGNRVIESNSLIHKSLASLIVQYRAINFVYNQFLNALYNIPKVGIQLESTTASLTATFGSAAAAGKELQFLTQEALRTGISVGVLREQYASAAASFIAAGESAETTRKIFENINTVATTLHLSGDRVSGVYLALSQVFNKTKLQAEELTKQLSQTIPGVTNQQAKALNITVSELYDSMKKGAISAHDAILALSETLGQTFGGDAFLAATKGLNAEWGRLNTTWTLFTENLYKGSQGILKEAVKDLINITNSLVDLTGNTQETKKAFDLLLSVITALAVGGALASLGTALNVLKGYILTTTAATNGFAAALTLVQRHPLVTGVVTAGAILTFFYSQSKAAEAAATSLAEYNRQLDIEFGRVKRNVEQEKRQAFENSDVYTTAKAKLEEQEKVVKDLENLTTKGQVAPSFLGPVIFKDTSKEAFERLKEAKILRDQIKTKIVKLDIEFNTEIAESNKKSIYDASEAVKHFEIQKYKLDGDEVTAARLQFIESNAKKLDELQQQYIDASEANNKEKMEEAAIAMNTYAEELAAAGLKALEKSTSSGTAKGTKAFNDALRQIGLTAEQQKTLVSESLDTLSEDYSRNLISIKDYFSQRTNLEKQYYTFAKQALQEQITVANSKGELGKAAELGIRLERLKQEEGKKSTQTRKEQIQAELQYADALYQVSEAYNKIKGVGSSVDDVYQVLLGREQDKIAQFEANNNLGAVDKVKSSARHNANLLVTQEYLANINILQDNFRRTEDIILAKKDAGLLTELQAIGQLTKARLEYLDVSKDSIEAIKELAEANKGDYELQLKYNDALSERNRLLNEANATLNQTDTSAFSDLFGANYDKFEKFLTRIKDLKGAREIASSPFDDVISSRNIQQDLTDAKGRLAPGSDTSIYDSLIGSYNVDQEAYKKAVDGKAKVDSKYTSQTAAAYAGMFSSIAGMGADAFLQMTLAAQKMYGAQSKEAQKAFKLYKALRIAEAIMAGAQAVISQLTIPYVGIALAAATVAITAFQIAQIQGQQLPAAHGGLDYVPKEQTYLLDKGERVLSPKQNRDLTNYINSGTVDSKQNTGNNVRIINAFDSSYVKDYMGSDEGAQVIMNVVKKEQEFA